MIRTADRRWHVCARLAVLLAITALITGSEARAEKLVVFKNGKAIRVKTVSQERGWARLELDGGAVLGVRSSQISVVDDAGASSVGKIDAVQNQASVGGAGGYVPPAYNAPPPDTSDSGGNDDQPVPNEAEVPSGQTSPPGGALINPAVPGARPFNNQPVSGLGGIGGRRPGSGLMPANGRQAMPSGSLFNRRGNLGQQQQQTQDSDSN